MIPAFAVGRTQELLYYFPSDQSERMIKGHDDFEVFVDSPLAVEATHVFKRTQLGCYDETQLLGAVGSIHRLPRLEAVRSQ